MDKTFGLRELGKLTEEIKVGKGDVRTIKVVLAVTGIPNTVATEAQTLINACKAKCVSLGADVVGIQKADTEDEAKTKATIRQVKDTRQHNKETNARKILQATTSTLKENSEITRPKEFCLEHRPL